jgi:parvulin-like peptidyl-prolyl isomerase
MKVILTVALVATAAIFFAACDSTGNPAAAGDAAATVNGKTISKQEVEKILNQQLQGQQSKLSELELAQARLQVLDNLIQQEVMFQRAEKEKAIPTEDEITKAINDQKTGSGMTAEEFEKRLKEAGETEAGLRELAKKQLAVKKMVDNVASKVEPPKDAEVEAFFKGNPDAFLRKRGAKFAAIVIDPQKVGEGDTTTNEQEAQLRLKEVLQKIQQGADFAAMAREYSEDQQTRLQGGDWQAFSEDQMRQNFGPQFADAVMNKAQTGQVLGAIPLEGRFVVLKLTQKQERDENLTLESPGVKQQITDLLVNARKQLVSQAFAARAMDEARVENYMAKQIVDNPNGLSGARPADPNAAASPAAAAASPAVSPAISPVANAANAAASPATSPAGASNTKANAANR